jgi:NADPH-dependent curcumin reductase CurA
MARRWTLAQRPAGPIRATDLALVEEPAPSALEKDFVLVKVRTLSVDAFVRTTLDEGAHHGSVPIGGTIPALGIGEVLNSTSRAYRPGDLVAGLLGATTHSVLPAAAIGKVVKLPGIPLDAMLAELGFSSGLTAWAGIHTVLPPPRRGEVVVVSAAAGAVGSAAAQIAKNLGATVIGITRASKTAYLLETLGLAGAVDYTHPTESIGAQLDRLAPSGVDFYFDNVGGEALDAVLDRIRQGGRVVICGAISQYESGEMYAPGGVRGPSSYVKLAERSATMAGFNMGHKLRQLPWILLRVAVAYWRGTLRLERHVKEGIEQFPDALLLMFSGGHTGKLLVHVSS